MCNNSFFDDGIPVLVLGMGLGAVGYGMIFALEYRHGLEWNRNALMLGLSIGVLI